MPSIMNRIAKESFFGGRSSQAGSQSRKGRNKASVVPAEEEADENLDLFSKNRLSLSLASPDQSVAASASLMRLSFGSGKVLKTGLDDLISSAEREKHDYDWLLTPPGTPLDPSSDGHASQATPAPSKKSALIRSQSVSTSKASSRDNKAGIGRVTPVSGGKLYPQSLRPAASKHQVPRTSTPSLGDNNTRTKLVGNNWANSENGRHFSLLYKMTSDLQEPDIFESYRHDASLLEEDQKSTNWLCSFDDKSDYSGLMFDSGLDLLPEPFGPL